jgi:predicted nucleotidyltransferase
MGVRVERAILFGSQALAKAKEESDIDLLIVSPDFERMNTRERLEVLGLAAARVWQPIEAIGCTPEELDKVEPATLLEEILETGVRVA